MALIRCPECKQTFSSTIDACPHCGYKISEVEKEIALADAHAKASPNSNGELNNKEDTGSTFGGFLLGLFLGLIGFIFGLAFGKKDTRAGAVAGFCIQVAIGLIVLIVTLATKI